MPIVQQRNRPQMGLTEILVSFSFFSEILVTLVFLLDHSGVLVSFS